MKEEEIWKDVPNYDGLYKVSNFGNVKSYDREFINGMGYKCLRKGKVLSQSISQSGYHYCTFIKPCDTKNKKIQTHQIVAMAFLNHSPKGHKMVVDHIDNNKLNNNLYNLQLVTNRENCSKDRCNKTSKYTGVSWYKKEKHWYAQIQIKGKRTHLGRYKNEYDAHLAYQDALKQLTY